MRTGEVVIATITLARSGGEEIVLERSFKELCALRLPVLVADGGSSERFTGKIKMLGSSVLSPKSNGLVPQVKASLGAALANWPGKRAVLYTEPDKYPFFRGALVEFVKSARPSASFGVAIAARDAKSFKTFPRGQQWAETFMNEAAGLTFGSRADYCYGPLLLSRRAAELALEAPEDLGWGWRFWLMGRAKRAGLKVNAVTMNLPCPKEQRGEDSKEDRLYRLKQLRQNLTGLALGWEE